MPIGVTNDYDGSWGDMSEDWPKIKFNSEKEASNAHLIAWKMCKVPYGSYVVVGKELRLANQKYVELVNNYIIASILGNSENSANE